MEFRDRDIHVVYTDGVLEIANRRLRRRIDWRSGWGRTLELALDDTILTRSAACGDFEIAGFPEPGTPDVLSCFHPGKVEVTPLNKRDGDGVQISMHSFEDLRRLRLTVSYIVYPELPVFGVEIAVEADVIPMMYRNCRARRQFNEARGLKRLRNVTDALNLPEFQVTESVEFQMRTDYFDEPVLRHAYHGEATAVGNLLFARDDCRRGFFYLLEAPPSQERRDHEVYDFAVENGRIAALAGGFNAEDITPGRQVVSHRAVLGVAADGDAAKLLKEYWRVRRPVTRRVGGLVTVNPWGGGDFPGHVSQTFLEDELRAAAALRADIYQIDDGYEVGGGLCELSISNRCPDRAWWAVNSRLLPDGFAPLARSAGQAGIALSLWFAPSFNREYRDWRESADILLDYYRHYGVRTFKLDAVMLESYEAEANFRRFLETLDAESGGEITVNLDVTNGIRGGLCEFGEFGSIFLENRYVCHEWATHPYHPENVLDNLWNIAHYCRIQELQIEVPNPGDLQVRGYEKRGMTPPDAYELEYWFAVALFASPLLWMSPSLVKPEIAGRLQGMLELHRRYRAEWRDALISPLGNRPDGEALTGFYADSGWVLMFRELWAPRTAHWQLPAFKTAELIHATSDAELNADGSVGLGLPGSWALFKVR